MKFASVPNSVFKKTSEELRESGPNLAFTPPSPLVITPPSPLVLTTPSPLVITTPSHR